MRQINIFVSYSHLDANWVSESDSFSLVPWLADNIYRDNAIIWYDHGMKQLPDEEYKRKIKAEIDAANIAILLISQNYAHSYYISEYELPWIKERLDARELIVIPILLEPTDFSIEGHLRWISKYQMFPGNETPLIRYTSNQADFLEIRLDILHEIQNWIKQLNDYPLYSHDRQFAKQSPASVSKLTLLISVFLIILLTIIVILVLKLRF